MKVPIKILRPSNRNQPLSGVEMALRMAARPVSLLITLTLLLFNLRRIVFTLAILLHGRRNRSRRAVNERLPEEPLPDVLILAPCRDEACMIQDLCEALSFIDYPCEKLRVVLIDDGSVDGTAGLLHHEVKGRWGWSALSLKDNRGKASALNTALAQFPFGEIVYIFDADHRPAPGVLRHAVRYFQDPKVAGVTGYTRVMNPYSSPSSYYSTVESFTNQMVTMRAKHLLNLAPAMLGSNCGYRRSALQQCGGFRVGAFSEDSDLTVTFYNAGYRVCFAEDAVSFQEVPQSVKGYLKQHIRWGRGLNDVAKTHALETIGNRRLSPLLRLELISFSAGYLDRIALSGAGTLTALSYLRGDIFRFPVGILLFALLTPFVQIVALFMNERVPTAMWVRLPLVPVFFVMDIFAAIRSTSETLLNQPRRWAKTERAKDNGDEAQAGGR